MKSEDRYEVRHDGQTSFGGGKDQSGTNLSPGLETDDIQARHTSQAERGVMHPERDDMEWRYWRGGWGRLTE